MEIDYLTERLAMIETLDNGQPIGETRHVDIPNTSDHFRYFAAAIRTDEGSAVMLDENDLSIVLREPLGVIAEIVPWNFPLLIGAWKLAPALAAGNCVVFKPSSSTSISMLELMQLIGDILPPGVLNVVTGSGSACGNYLIEHEGINKISFTGSTTAGLTIAKRAAEKIISATLELGGKSANIIFPDADIKAAVEGVQMGILFNQGQVCCAGSRVFFHEDIYDYVVEACAAAFEQVEPGLPWEETTRFGSLIDERQMKRVLDYIVMGKKEGAFVAAGGYRVTDGNLKDGYYVKPTLLANVTNDMRVAQEEIFGPVAVVIKFRDEDEVIRLANDSIYGLAGAVWTKDINRAIRVARSIETGKMWVNCYNMLMAHTPFGGYKKSGIGREIHKMAL